MKIVERRGGAGRGSGVGDGIGRAGRRVGMEEVEALEGIAGEMAREGEVGLGAERGDGDGNGDVMQE